MFYNIFRKNVTKEIRDIPLITADIHEKNSLILAELHSSKEVNLEIKPLKIADYLIGNIAIERKTISDFISSMINGRLLKQLEELKQFENKLLIVEGLSKQEIYTDENSNINANAIRGFLLSILLKHKIPIIFTKDSEDTAKFIDVLSRKKAKDVRLNAGKKMLNKKEQMQFIIESFPGIGPKKSKELLKKFGSIQNIINAPKEDLEKILGKRAGNFIEIINRKF